MVRMDGYKSVFYGTGSLHVVFNCKKISARYNQNKNQREIGQEVGSLASRGRWKSVNSLDFESPAVMTVADPNRSKGISQFFTGRPQIVPFF